MFVLLLTMIVAVLSLGLGQLQGQSLKTTYQIALGGGLGAHYYITRKDLDQKQVGSDSPSEKLGGSKYGIQLDLRFTTFISPKSAFVMRSMLNIMPNALQPAEAPKSKTLIDSLHMGIGYRYQLFSEMSNVTLASENVVVNRQSISPWVSVEFGFGKIETRSHDPDVAVADNLFLAGAVGSDFSAAGFPMYVQVLALFAPNIRPGGSVQTLLGGVIVGTYFENLY